MRALTSKVTLTNKNKYKYPRFKNIEHATPKDNANEIALSIRKLIVSLFTNIIATAYLEASLNLSTYDDV